ncbi:MAG: hypothetical protein V4850_28490 [Myxococcota bacterium]
MRRRCLLALVALLTLSDAARAAEGSTIVGVQASVAGGPWIGTSNQEIDAELAGVDWPELPAVAPEFQVRFGLTVFDATLDLHFQGNDQRVEGTSDEREGLEHHRVAIGADLGYRFRLGRIFTLSPFVGIGSVTSTLCLAGQPDATSSPSSPPFEQVLRNPGLGMCLKSAEIGLDAGLGFAANMRFEFERQKGQALAGYLSVGPRVGFTQPLGSARTWEQASSELSVDLPAFEGPKAPMAGVFVGIEAQFRFSLEAVP